MQLIAHNSMEEAKESANVLAELGTSARKLLAEVVEKSSVNRTKLSKAAKDLENAGFLFIRDHSNIWESEFEFSSTLSGEEALEVLDEI
jgi:hypothetical protein